MCYSPEADLVAGVVIGAIGIDAMRHVDDRRSMLALAAVPVVLAGHQLVEAFAWWSLEGRLPPDVGTFAASAYLLIAFGVVPVLVPYAVMRSEPMLSRRRAMTPFVLLGLGVAAVLVFGLMTTPHTATIGGRYIEYAVVIPAGGVLTILYGFAVCTPLLMSSQRRIVTFGMINVPILLGLSALLGSGLISLWCAWAAVASLMIAAHVRATSRASTVSRSQDLVAG